MKEEKHTDRLLNSKRLIKVDINFLESSVLSQRKIPSEVEVKKTLFLF